MACDLQEASYYSYLILVCSGYKSRQCLGSTKQAGLRSITCRGYPYSAFPCRTAFRDPKISSCIPSSRDLPFTTFLLVPFSPLLPLGITADFAIGAALSQRDEKGRLHRVAFHSRKLQLAEINYEIYDKELDVTPW